MTLVKWTPRPINISNDFDDMFRTLFHSEVENPLNKEIDWKPEIDIKNIIDNSNDHYHYRERSVGKFKRSFNLPESINRDKIHASFKNGILSIELEKHEEIVPKEMEISIS